MTITYTAHVSNSNFSSFFGILFRWRGSIWKAVVLEFFLWVLIYFTLSLIYRFALSDEQQTIFERICVLCYRHGDFIPITFMMGFYVSLVVSRWWMMFNNIGWIDNVGLIVASYVKGTDEKGRMIRRSMIRYVCLMQVLVFRAISIRVRKRFPTLETLVAAGYVEEHERVLLDDSKFWMPIRWTMHLARDARKENRIESDNAVQTIFEYICEFRSKLMNLWFTDWVPVPLVYTQVIFVSVRLYFIVALLGRQYLNVENQTERGPIDAYIPFLTLIQFICYVGWSKVAEALLNPFGEDDDDFECNWIIDRNLQVGMTIVDCKPEVFPSLVPDKFWNDSDVQLLYSLETATLPQNPNVGSAALRMSSEKYSNGDISMVPRMRSSRSHVEADRKMLNSRRCSMPVRPFTASNNSSSQLAALDRINKMLFNRRRSVPLNSTTQGSSPTAILDQEANVGKATILHPVEEENQIVHLNPERDGILTLNEMIRSFETVNRRSDNPASQTEKPKIELPSVDENDELKQSASSASLKSASDTQQPIKEPPASRLRLPPAVPACRLTASEQPGGATDDDHQSRLSPSVNFEQ